jgi:SAM-dependent methyltransferase
MIDTCDEHLLEWSRYHDFINAEFFYDLDNKHVLEIGAFSGAQTQAILRHDVGSLTVVEPNYKAVSLLSQKYPTIKIIEADIFDVYNSDLSCDVIVCLGLLYHLHSPLYLLECMVNKSQPKIIILDNQHCDFLGQQGLLPETSNIPGNMHAKRSLIPFAVAYSFPNISQAMTALGYQMTKYQDLVQFPEIKQKSSSWMARWEKL